MMKQEKISMLQLLFIMISFEIGSTVLFGLGMEAKQDEWLAILAAMLCGLALMWVYTKFYDYYPSLTLIQMIPRIAGKWIGYPLAVVYILDFAYEASRVLRDFGELIVQTILIGTPIMVIMGGFVFSIVYCLRGGLEVFGRMGELMFPVGFLAFSLVWLFLFASSIPDLLQLQPVLEGGIQAVWNAAFPFIIVFPFGEALLFMMFFAALRNPKTIKKTGMLAILVSGLLLTVNMMGLISMFGPDVLSRIQFPLYTSVGMVDLGDFIMNLDVFAILMMVLGGFFKIGAFLYGAVLGTAQLFKIDNYRIFLIPWGTIITAMSMIIAANYVEHLYVGWRISIPFLFFPLYVVVPVLLLIVAAIRNNLVRI